MKLLKENLLNLGKIVPFVQYFLSILIIFLPFTDDLLKFALLRSIKNTIFWNQLKNWVKLEHWLEFFTHSLEVAIVSLTYSLTQCCFDCKIDTRHSDFLTFIKILPDSTLMISLEVSEDQLTFVFSVWWTGERLRRTAIT